MSEGRVLYWGAGSANCWRVQITLEEKGLSYESRLLDLKEGEHKTEEVLALNPRGQVPTFKDGDAVVNESPAIVIYLEGKYPEKSLLPSDPVEKAKTLQRFFEIDVTARTFREFVGPKRRGLEIPNQAEVIEKVKAELDLWERYLGQQKYAATDAFTIADVVLAPGICVYARIGMTFKDHPNLKRYHEMIKDHPSVAKTMPPHWEKIPADLDIMSMF